MASSIVLATHAIPVLASNATAGWKAVSLTGIAALIGLLTVFRTRPVPGEPLLAPLLLVVIGGSFSSPVRIMTIAIAVFAAQALRGTGRAWLIRTVLGLAVLPAGTVLGLAVLPAGTALGALTGAGTLSWRSSDVLGLVPFVVPVGLVMRNILRALVQQELVSARDALLSSAGGRLLAAANVDEVHRIGIDLTARMIALAPGLVLIIVRPQGAEWRVTRAVGLDDGLIGRTLTEAMLADPATALADVAPDHRHWHVEHIVDRYVLLGGVRPISPTEADAFRTLAHQVVLGEHNVTSRAELQHRAHHDSLTRLPNREYFLETLTDAVTSGPPGSVAVISVDLDDFKQVNDTYGHGGGDELLIEVANRLRAAAGPHRMAARLGGDEFALLLTGPDAQDEAERLAWDVRDRILAPFRVTGHTVRVGASVGISGPSHDVATLIREADLAMYAAKALRSSSRA
ncbi:GGDEF domain-containing protein [Actinoplanes sp. NPDC051470]|uniref:GGDEF domain-containing protein n=1 Tax=Actinoplanes sp. NPDC051470 TaxID=3157224 RepID=UPI003437A105